MLIDPVTYQETEEKLERARLIAAIRAGEQAIQEGRRRPAEEVFAELKAEQGSEHGRPRAAADWPPA